MQAERARGIPRLALVDHRPELTLHPGRSDPSLAISTKSALTGVILALCGVGLVMVLSASAWTSLSLNGSVWTIFERQALWMGIGATAFIATSRIDYNHWRKFRLLIGALAIALCVLVLVPGIGVDAGGSSRWIGFGQLRLQPSELMKLAVVLFGADLLTRRADLLARSRSVVLPLLSWLGVACVLLIAQPDMGTAIVVTCITFSLLFAAGVPLRPIAKTVGSVAVLCVIAGIAEPYRRDRLLSFLNPFAHSSGTGYQVVQSLVGIGSGRLYGLGLGASREKWGLLPNPHTDFIFSIIGEETGLVGSLVVLALFLWLGWLGLRAARNAPDRFSMLVAVGITCWIVSQAVINVGAVIDVLPVTGIPLPFISFGGSSLVITLAAAGILVNIASKERSPRRRAKAPALVP
jgi:cell division protein FtsW